MKINCSHSKLIDIDLLVPNPKNPNKHPKRQIELLSKIIKHQGQRLPIIVSKRSGFVVSGHGRLEAMKLLGWTSCAIDEQNFQTEADEYAHMIADNKIAELAESDNQLIIETLKTLPEFDHELLGMPDFKLVDIQEVNLGDENQEWIKENMPEFTEGEKYIKLVYIFASEENRAKFVEENNITIEKKLSNQWIVYG